MSKKVIRGRVSREPDLSNFREIRARDIARLNESREFSLVERRRRGQVQNEAQFASLGMKLVRALSSKVSPYEKLCWKLKPVKGEAKEFDILYLFPIGGKERIRKLKQTFRKVLNSFSDLEEQEAVACPGYLRWRISERV